MRMQILTLALSAVSMVSALSSTVEPSIVHVLVTSTITVQPSQTSATAQNLQARQWDPAPSAPAWSEPANSWVEQPWAPETQPAWAPSSVAAPWDPTGSFAAITPATTNFVLLPSASATNNPYAHSNPKETEAHGIIAGVIIASFCAIGFVGALVTVIRRKCAGRKTKSNSGDVEMTAGLAGKGSTRSSRVVSTHSMDSGAFEPSPVRGRSIIEMPRNTYYPPQPTHWPPEEMETQTTGNWSRGRGYGRVG